MNYFGLNIKKKFGNGLLVGSETISPKQSIFIVCHQMAIKNRFLPVSRSLAKK